MSYDLFQKLECPECGYENYYREYKPTRCRKCGYQFNKKKLKLGQESKQLFLRCDFCGGLIIRDMEDVRMLNFCGKRCRDRYFRIHGIPNRGRK